MGAAATPGEPGSGRPGQIAGYRLDKYIGQGSTAAVYLARDERQHRQVALKVLAPELARDPAFRARMIRESRAAAAVDHPHIIPVYEASESSGTLYVAMRYVSGGNVRSLLNRLGPLPPGYAWRLIAQIASALDAAHARGLIHRDVKPANILLDAGDPDSGHAYLSDFGMSKALTSGQIIATGVTTGTLDYAAPEQIEGRDLNGRADLYSLACTGFELLCGSPPFGQDQGLTLMYAQLYAPPPAATAKRAALPAAVNQVLATALAKDPAERYPDCARFAGELHAALALGGDTPPAPPRPHLSGRPAPVTGSRPADPPAAEEQPAAEEPVADETGGADPGARRPRLLRPILAVAAVVVVTGAVVSGVALSKRPPHGRPAVSAQAVTTPAAPAPSPSLSPVPSSAPSSQPSPAGPVTASAQAAAVGTLLNSSAATRTALLNAVNQVGACTNLSGAVGQLQAVVNQRASQYSQASALSTSALPAGPVLKSRLMTVLGNSLKADRDYLTWAHQQLDGGCAPFAQSGAYNAAHLENQVADAAKQAFVQAWNPVAAEYGIERNSAENI